jgi:sulfate/thiosulfate transport system substrate-binding protein
VSKFHPNRQVLPRRALLAGSLAAAFSSGCDASVPVPGPAASASPEVARAASEVTITNVSYDPTREFYAEYNALFAKHWLAVRGERVKVKQSHGGSATQARAVIDGLEADVVTLALGLDISALAKHGGLVYDDWQTRLPYRSSPYTSTIVLLVRKGNPKGIRDFGDLARPGVGVITPNPKTGGGARWNYLALWGFALKQPGGNENKARELVSKVFGNVLVLDSGARGSTTTFTRRGIGDALITWENEGMLALGKNPNDFELVVPTASILAEPPVSVVDKVVDRRGTRTVAQAYLRYLFAPEVQELIAKYHFRPSDPAVLARHAAEFPALALFTIDELFGGWEKAQSTHFEDGGVFDQLYRPRK